MKLSNRLTPMVSLLLVSGVVWGHAGHEALGDGGHIEYLLAAGASRLSDGNFVAKKKYGATS